MSPMSMVAINTTCARKHDVLLLKVATLAQTFGFLRLPIGSVGFEFFVPEGHKDKFKLGQVEGALDQWGWIRGQERNCIETREAKVPCRDSLFHESSRYPNS